ncbi:MAG: HD-GYP domain-containing protein [Anaerovoracaceae bacterium]
MVFTYIFPLLTLIVLYHQPKLVLFMGVASFLINIIYDVQLYSLGQITMETSKDVEIQLALIILCFGFLYVASRMYDDIQKKNEMYLKEIEDKNKEIKNMTLETITTIANIIDAKDEYTKGHSQRVAEYASAIARELGYSEEEINNIRYIALLHDIGKIGIPDSILKKPDRLTDDEFRIMKEHVDIGGNILKGNTFINELEKGAKYHHERYDGTGYTEGLKGEAIPRIARIIGVADAFDAMTSNRVYRASLSEEKVISELKKNSGSQFDPEITDVLLRIVKEQKSL